MRHQAGRLQRISSGRHHRVLPTRADCTEIEGRLCQTPAFHRNALQKLMKHRQKRVNELLKRELSIIVAREITFEDALVTINQVNVASDLKKAHVYVSVLGPGRATVIAQLEAHRAALQT